MTNPPGREIYASANGDRWRLLRDPTTGHCFIRHTGNAASGGHISEIGLSAFLAAGGAGPEHQELWRLIGTLVDDGGPAPGATVVA